MQNVSIEALFKTFQYLGIASREQFHLIALSTQQSLFYRFRQKCQAFFADLLKNNTRWKVLKIEILEPSKRTLWFYPPGRPGRRLGEKLWWVIGRPSCSSPHRSLRQHIFIREHRDGVGFMQGADTLHSGSRINLRPVWLSTITAGSCNTFVVGGFTTRRSCQFR